MSSSMDTINHKLQSLEERLHAQNRSHESLRNGTDPTTMAVPGTTTTSSMGHMIPTTIYNPNPIVGSSIPNTRQQPPRLNLLPTTPQNRRKIMHLPVTPKQPKFTETDAMLKKINKLSGLLTIDGAPYQTKLEDLQHLGDLGNGTSGNVVKMRHKLSGKIIAVKQMRRTGNTEENKRILMDLDVVLKSHDCEYIVQCLGCFVRESDVWICMELMSMCFDKVLKLSKKPVPEYILGKVSVATARALSYLKDKHDVIHRDVKPSNILIDERGNIKLCDFGISGRLVDSKAATRSAGCAAYMAPERIDPKKLDYDIRADVWSLGITLVELATARSPYEGCNTDFEVLTKILELSPPSLPSIQDGYNFSDGFRDFVRKCLTKDFLKRPKYPELLEQPFIKYYEQANIDVSKWFKETVETAGIKTHSRATTTSSIASSAKHNNGTTTIPTAIISSNTKTINSKANGASPNGNGSSGQTVNSQIPMFQQKVYHHRKDDQQYPSVQSQLYLQQKGKNDGVPNIPASHLPQPIGSYFGSHHLQVGDKGGGGSGSSSATSSSPLSPPSYSYQANKDNTTIVNEMNKLYRKSSSPFLQRKYSNGSKYKYTDESPKKESMFSNFGQTILRNLTTSPFSQKKNVGNGRQQHQQHQQHTKVDSSWQLNENHKSPTSSLNYDNWDGGPPLQNIANSPAFGRKRFQPLDTKLDEQHPLQGRPSLIPVNHKHDSAPPTKVQGNHSPIVLQRFYHQQNQLREKELEKQKLQQQKQNLEHHQHLEHQQNLEHQQLLEHQQNLEHQQHLEHQHHHQQHQQKSEEELERLQYSPDVITTNPFLSTYVPPSPTTSLNYHHHHHDYEHHHYQQEQVSHDLDLTSQQIYQSHLGATTGSSGISSGSSAISSSHSTSSQSSTQSSNSQIGAPTTYLKDHNRAQFNLQQQQQQTQAISLSSVKTGIFGANPGHLQYQPLPQQYVNTSPNFRKSKSPPISTPENEHFHLANLKKSEKYHQHHHQQHHQHHNNEAINPRRLNLTNNVIESKDFRSGSDQGWLNTLTGAMKRQISSYVKFHLNNSTANSTITTPTTPPTSTISSLLPPQQQQQPTTIMTTISSSSPSSPSSSTSYLKKNINKDNKIPLTNFLNGIANPSSNLSSSSPSSITTYGSSLASGGSTSASPSALDSTIPNLNSTSTSIPNSPTTFNNIVANNEKPKNFNYFRSIPMAGSTIPSPSPQSQLTRSSLAPLPLSTATTVTTNSNSNATSSNTSPTTDNYGSSSSTSTQSLSTKMNYTNDFPDGGTSSSFLRRYAITSGSSVNGSNGGITSGNSHLIANLDRRHRSPDPPPRYNRGQSPLLLRKNLLELTSGQQTGNTVSPLFNRRFVTASPPLPPPRRGSESVPGSPQHFRSRIHYTPEPQRRIYRTIDQ